MGNKSNRRDDHSAGDDSNRLPHAEKLRAKWKHEIKKLPPALREAWLKTQEAISALGAKNVVSILAALEKQDRAVCRTACSQSWMHAWSLEGIVPHGLALVDTTLRRREPGRKYSVKLVRGFALVRYGSSEGAAGDLPVASRGNRRWTPEISVEQEDHYDLMSVYDAEMCQDPPSITGLQFQRIEAYRGKEVGHSVPRDRAVSITRDVGNRLRGHMVDWQSEGDKLKDGSG